jgi:glucosamine--fructose-6-phosphate aminotransferase (isomerizing)
MCGIIAYIGDRQAAPILVAGLKRLEYRGYDSAGVGLIVAGADGSSVIKTVKKTVCERNIVLCFLVGRLPYFNSGESC